MFIINHVMSIPRGLMLTFKVWLTGSTVAFGSGGSTAGLPAEPRSVSGIEVTLPGRSVTSNRMIPGTRWPPGIWPAQLICIELSISICSPGWHPVKSISTSYRSPADRSSAATCTGASSSPPSLPMTHNGIPLDKLIR